MLFIMVGLAEEDWTGDARFFEYSRAANPIGSGFTSEVPIESFSPALHKGGPTRTVALDLSAELGIEMPPSLFLRLVGLPWAANVPMLRDHYGPSFDPEGFRFDMTFWPAVCYCDACKKRFAGEVGGAIPTAVNWLDERWVAFQHRREAWLAESAVRLLLEPAVGEDPSQQEGRNGHQEDREP